MKTLSSVLASSAIVAALGLTSMASAAQQPGVVAASPPGAPQPGGLTQGQIPPFVGPPAGVKQVYVRVVR